MLSRSSTKLFRNIGSISSGLGKRGIVISPATNENPAHVFSPVLPFGFDFVSDDLRKSLESSNIDVDSLERKYNVQIQNDAEFNSPALPSEGSPLWGYIYANRLVKSKVHLDTLRKDEEYLLNYLRATCEELEQRMNRYYPKLDWKGEYKRQLNQLKHEMNSQRSKEYDSAKVDAITSVITDNENGDDKYISLFGNNSFIDKYDESDKFNDYLPSTLEEKLISYFEYYFDHSSDNVSPSKYFDNIQSIENIVSTPMNALSKEIKQNFGLYVLDCFGNNSLDLIRDLVSAANKASSSLVDANASGSVADCLALLDMKTGKVSATSGDILGRLFFGNSDAGNQLSGKDVSEITNILSSAGEERISLIYRALELENSLKNNSIGRIFISLILSMNREYTSQFLTNSENISSFGSLNSSLLDNIVTTLKSFNASQVKLSTQLNTFITNVTNTIIKDRNGGNKGEIELLIRNTLINNVTNTGNVDCLVVSSLREYSNNCGENGNTFGQLKGLTLSNYFNNFGNNSFVYTLFNGIINPPRNGISGKNLSLIANGISQNTSDATDELFNNIGNYLISNGLVNSSESGSIVSNLSSLVSKDLDSLKTVCNEFNSTRIENENALKAVTLNTDESFNFEHIMETYDPLNVHLAQYRYLSNN